MQDIRLNELKSWEESILNQLKFIGYILLMVSSRSTFCIYTKSRHQ